MKADNIIIKDEDGNSVEYSVGMEQSDSNSDFINQTIESLNYISSNGGKKHVKRLVNSERDYNVVESDKANSFLPSAIGGTIKFNSTQVNEYLVESDDDFDQIEVVTAVTILAHEIDHAAQNEKYMAKGDRTGNYDKALDFQAAVGVPFRSKRADKEERRAIRGLERKIANSLGQYRRKSHSEKAHDIYNSSGPLTEF